MWWQKVRKILGWLTDILTAGRAAGLWRKKHGPQSRPEKPHRPGP